MVSQSIRLKNTQPTLFVKDVEKAFAFYRQFGFVKHFQNEDIHLVIKCDDVILHLATYWFEGICGCQIMVDGVDALYAMVLEKGIPVKHEIGEQSWGNRDFTIEDPDGNLITFSQRIVERT